MKIKVPDGSIYDIEECELIEDDLDKQSKLAEELFENTGILVANKEGGEDYI